MRPNKVSERVGSHKLDTTLQPIIIKHEGTSKNTNPALSSNVIPSVGAVQLPPSQINRSAQDTSTSHLRPRPPLKAGFPAVVRLTHVPASPVQFALVAATIAPGQYGDN